MTNTQKKVLIYGQVQSGKTSRIIEYVRNNSININILMIQNNLSMLAQYEKALENYKIFNFTVSNKNVNFISRAIGKINRNIVLIVMNNNYRREALEMLISKAKIKKYSLIMDESDLYHRNLKITNLYEKATECVHVTATPFLSDYNAYFDDVIVIPPKEEYVSLKKLDIKFIPEIEVSELNTVMNIVSNDFLKEKQGIMLITIHKRITHMETLARQLYRHKSLTKVPIVMLSSNNMLYFNSKIKELPKLSISEIISGLDEHQHIIFIANRLATRGINYSDTTYTRHLTHQIINKNNSMTNFIQRCRILGNKQGMSNKLKLYCFDCDEEYFQKVLEKVENIEKNIEHLKVGYVKPVDKPKLVRTKTV